MKYLSFLVIPILICFSSCSDKVEPDITADIVGVYKEYERGSGYEVELTWLITKASNTKVRITISEHSKIYGGEEKTNNEVLDNVQLIDNRTISFDQEGVQDGVKYKVQGTGLLSGKNLVVSIKSSNLSTKEEYSVNYNLTKQ